jgi:drug/metabolite transporter (DMT)-like permease
MDQTRVGGLVIPARYVNLIWLLALGTLWGSSYLFIKIVVAEIPALVLVAGRLLVASIALWIIVRVLGLKMPRSGRVWRTYALLGFLGAAAPYTLITWGEQYIPSGLAALLQSTTPIFALLLAQVLPQDDRITLLKVVGVIVGFVGVGLLMWPDLSGGWGDLGSRSNLLGQLAIVGSSLCYALTAILARDRLRGQHPLCSATGQLSMGAVYALIGVLLTGSSFDLALSGKAWASWAGLTLFGTILAYGIYFTLIERGGATYATMVTYVIPINGLLLGALVLGESLSLTIWLSLLLILSGVLLVRGREERESRAPESDDARSRRIGVDTTKESG